MPQRIRKAVIPAAGLGTRFLPATKAQPKEMLPIVDKPTIQYIVEEAISSGIDDILIITGRNKRAIEDHFDVSIELEESLKESNREGLLRIVQEVSQLVDIHYLRQKAPLGLGHAVYCARTFVGNEPFAVMLGDDIVYSREPVLKQMIDAYDELGGNILGVQKVAAEEVSKYGICDTDPSSEPDVIHRVRTLVEKPDPESAPASRLAIMGRYIISPRVFSILARTQPGAGSEIQLTDALRELAKVEPVFAYEFNGRRYDVGDKLGFLRATVEYALRDSELGDAFRVYLQSISSHLDDGTFRDGSAGSDAERKIFG